MKRIRRAKKDFSFLGFLFGAKIPTMLIFINCAVFWYLTKYSIHEDTIKDFVLYPDNLFSGNIYCLFTSGFIHLNPSHLFWNMLGVFIFGRIVERQLGMFKTLLIYLGTLGISMLFSTSIYVFILHKNIAIIGASGAVMGLLSTAMLLEPFCITYEMILPIPIMIKGWLFLYADIKGFMGNETDGVSHLAHLCGFLSIAVLVYFLSKKDKKLLHSGLLINIVSFVAFLFLRNWLIK